jgi:hypothetical protein
MEIFKGEEESALTEITPDLILGSSKVDKFFTLKRS